MIISGANNLYNNRKTVDELNVFPVPDGDTGTNMSLTATAMATELLKKGNTTLTKAADTMSFATLRGARGNSGVILSQFFRGISKSLKGKTECNAEELAVALKDGSDAAYKAVMKPTEGTILTVSREVATGAQLAANTYENIIDVMESAIERGNKALQKTTQMLPALRQAGVVDAGGQGWMFVLEGALSYLKSGNVVERQGEALEMQTAPVKKKSQEAIKTEDIKFKYCTEFIVEKKQKGLSVSTFRDTIAPKGDCMLVIDDDEIVKVHIHTNHPGFVLEEAIKLGEMINLKIDNMKHQHKSIIDGSNEQTSENAEVKTAEVKAEKKTEKPKKAPKQKAPVELKDYGFVAVCMGKGITNILKDLGVDRVIEGGQTMNPSTDDILKAVKRGKAKTVYVFPNNKNIILAAEQVRKLLGASKVSFVPSTNLAQGLAALLRFDSTRSMEENTVLMTQEIKETVSGSVTVAVRDSVVNGIQVHEGDYLGILNDKIVCTGKCIKAVLEQMLQDGDYELVSMFYGADLPKEDAEALADDLRELNDDWEVETFYGGQPLYDLLLAMV